MNEKDFVQKLVRKMRGEMKKYEVVEGTNLLYKLIIDTEGKVAPANYEEPKRGNLAFQTDILIKDKNVPLVVIEVKYGGFSTHD
ncbi:unnamed protein product, partial [marine sediment metagenome]